MYRKRKTVSFRQTLTSHTASIFDGNPHNGTRLAPTFEKMDAHRSHIAKYTDFPIDPADRPLLTVIFTSSLL
ncbi:hypothetical protein V2A60_002844 [Cordyceps javanica]